MDCLAAEYTTTWHGLAAMMATYLSSMLTLLKRKITKNYNKVSMIYSYSKTSTMASKKNSLSSDSTSVM
jgi:hypothetical protein